MGTRISGACEGFEVAVRAPERGERELDVEVVFAPDGPAGGATVEVQMYARALAWKGQKEGDWDARASVPGTLRELERGDTGRVRATLPLPASVASYRGTGIEITAVLVTKGGDGSLLRLPLDPPPPPPDARLVVEDLAQERKLKATGLSRLRRGRPRVRFEEARPGAVAVTVAGPRALAGGRVVAEAFEYHDRPEPQYDEWGPVATSEAPLAPVGDGRLRGELALPDPTAAPPSLECAYASRRQGVRWQARLELEEEGGRTIRGRIPLEVGIERPG